jgi:hypothetical protein
MIRVLLAIIVLVITSLACGTYVPTVTPTAAPSATPTPTATPVPTATVTPFPAAEDVNTVTIRAVVYIRAEADANSADLGALETGRTVELIMCGEQWCNVTAEIDGKQVTGWVYRGCTSDPAGLSCEAR